MDSKEEDYVWEIVLCYVVIWLCYMFSKQSSRQRYIIMVGGLGITLTCMSEDDVCVQCCHFSAPYLCFENW